MLIVENLPLPEASGKNMLVNHDKLASIVPKN